MALVETDLGSQAAFLKDCLAKSQSNHERLMGILGSFDRRLSSLESAMGPTQRKTEQLRKAHSNIDRVLKSASTVLNKFDVPRQLEDRIRAGPKASHVQPYLEAIASLESAIAYFEANKSFKSTEQVLAHTKSMHRDALAKLEDAMRTVLLNQTEAVDPSKLARRPEGGEDKEGGGGAEGEKEGEESKRGYPVPVLVAPEAAHRIQGLAQGMIQSGHEKLCLRTFREGRSAKLEAGLRRIGVEKLSREDLEAMEWKELEKRIEGWRKQVKLAIHVVLMAERTLCEMALKDLEPHTGRAFAELGEQASDMLFTFANAIANTKKTPEKLALLMDMYETMRDLMPQVNVVFAGQACSSLRVQAQGVLQSLASAAKETFNKFEEAVETEDSDKMPSDGSTHGLTSYVVNYLKYLCDYQATLQELFNADNMAEATVRIFTALQKNLEKKARLYRDPAQRELFLMNNMHYIVHAVKKSELRDILGEDWVSRHRRTVQQHAKAYQQTAWNNLFTLLTSKGLTTGKEGKEDQVSKAALKERFKTFNLAFEELHRTQCLWKIPDEELCSAVQLQIAEVLLPAYRSFVTRYKPILESSTLGRREVVSKHIKFSEESLDELLNEFFLGKESPNPLVANPAATRAS